jgi:hypothetical protein
LDPTKSKAVPFGGWSCFCFKLGVYKTA